MKKTQKFLCTFISALMVISGAAACGTPSTDNSANSSSVDNTPVSTVAYDGSKVTVTFYHTMGANLRAVLDKYIPVFNEMYPNITIEHSTMGDYDGLRDQISNEISGAGNSPSMAYCYPDHVALYNMSKKVIPLDSYIASTDLVTKADGSTETMGFTQAQLDDFVETYYAEGSVYGDGLTYTLPYAKSTEVLYYNKTEFEKNGWTVPTTWDEMETLCKAILQKYPKGVVPFGYDSEANWFITMCEQYGSEYTSSTKGSYFLFDNETNRNFVAKFTEWYDLGYFETEGTLGTYTSDLFSGTGDTKSFMCIGSSGGASYQMPSIEEGSGDSFAFETGIAMIPQVDKNNPKVISQGPSLCLFKKPAQEQAAAWLFAKFLTTHVPLQAQFSMKSGYAPVIKSAEENDVYKAFLDKANGTNYIQASAVKQSLLQKDAYYISPAFVGSSAARESVGTLMSECISNGYNDSNIAKAFSDAVKALKNRYDK